MTPEEAAQAEAESIATRWVPAHMTARQGMVDDIARALVTGRRLVEEARAECERCDLDIVALKMENDRLKGELADMDKQVDALEGLIDTERQSRKETENTLFFVRKELQKTKGELAEARGALKNCAEVMRIQEKRANEQFHLSAQAFMPMWSSAVEVAEVILAATPAEQAQPTLDSEVKAHGMGQEDAERAIGAWLAEQGADDVADKVASGEWRRPAAEQAQGEAVPRYAVGVDTAVPGSERTVHRCTGCEWSLNTTAMTEETVTKFVHEHLRAAHNMEAAVDPVAELAKRMEKMEAVVKRVDLEHAEMCPQHMGLAVPPIDEEHRDIRSALTRTACRIDDRVDALAKRVEATEKGMDMHSKCIGELSAWAKMREQRPFTENFRRTAPPPPEAAGPGPYAHRYVNDGKKRCEVCGMTEGYPDHAVPPIPEGCGR